MRRSPLAPSPTALVSRKPSSLVQLAILCWTVLVPVASHAGTSGPPIRFTYPEPLGHSDVPLAAVDMDGDGDDDLIARGTGVAVILMGDLHSPLSVRIVLPLTAGDSPAAAHDMDRDGRPDLITMRGSDSTIAVYRNLGSLFLAAPVRYHVPTSPGGVLVGDVTGDDRPDLIVTPSADGPVFTLLCQPDGTLAPGLLTAGGRFGAAVVADLDGDARDDVATLGKIHNGQSYFLELLMSNGDGSFESVVGPAWDRPFYGVSAGDLNGDGRTDLVLGGRDSLEVWLGTGGADFELRWVRVGAVPTTQTPTFHLADLDRDSQLDLLFLSRGLEHLPEGGRCFDGTCPQLQVLKGTGSELFNEPIEFSAYRPEFIGVPYPTDAVLGDFDDNNSIDVAYWIGQDESVHLARNTGSGEFQLPSSVQLPFQVQRVRVANSSFSAEPTFLLWDGAQTLRAAVQDGYTLVGLAPLADGRVEAAEDLDGDALDDVVTASGDSVRILFANGLGGYSPPLILTGMRLLALAELDGANGRDLVVANTTGRIHARYNDGSRAFGNPVDLGLDVPALTTSAAGLDLDADGSDELLFGVRHGGPTARLDLHWNTQGVLGPPVSYVLAPPTLFGQAGSPSTIARGDINGDGLADLFVVVEQTSDQMSGFSILLGAGSRQFAAVADYEASRDPREGIIHDFNHDGLDDILVVCDTDNSDGRVDVFQAQQGGSLLRLPSRVVEHYPVSLAHGDWNHDGAEDIVVANRFTRSLTFLRNLVPHPSTLSTPAAMALVSSTADAEGVRLEWNTSSSAREFTLERAIEPNAWQPIATIRTEGDGRIEALDPTATPGTRYGYRLSWHEAGAPQRGPETWIQVPGEASLRLSISSAGLNPGRGTPQVSLRLPTTEPATIELYDTAGRRLASDTFTPTSPGRFTRTLRAARVLVPGVYLARVQQSGQSTSARLIVLE